MVCRVVGAGRLGSWTAALLAVEKDVAAERHGEVSRMPLGSERSGGIEVGDLVRRRVERGSGESANGEVRSFERQC